MSEFPTVNLVNLVLGIIGTVAGVVALAISYLTYRKEKPQLKIEVSKCEHNYEESNKTLSFWIDFMIKNIGDRGTSIEGIALAFEDSGRKYSLEMEHYGQLIDSELKREGWIRSHETIGKSQTAYTSFEGAVKERIECTLTIYHTHGEQHVKVVSEKGKQS